MRIRIVLCAGIVLCLVGTLAADTTWMGPKGGKWSDPANWSAGLPDAADKVHFVDPSACILDFEGAVAWQVDNGGGPLKIVNGGSLTVLDWHIVGYGAGDTGSVEVYDGGVLNCNVRFFVGFRGVGTLTVYEGGTVNVHTEQLGVGEEPTGDGSVKLEGGTLNLLEGTDAESLNLYTGKASVDFWGGALTLQDTPENQDYLARAIGDGIIKAYGGVGEVVVDPDETPGRIIVRGLHPFKPLPADDSRVSAGDVELSWVLPDPCQPGAPVPVDVYFGTSAGMGSPETPKIVSQQNITSLLVKTDPKVRYYWAVDVYIGSVDDPVWGPVFNFVADNLPPEVDAGKDVVTWLADGVRAGNLDATVIDDGAISPYTVQWTVVSEPNEGNAVIETATAEDASITLAALGEYVLQLEAFDGEYTNSDTVTINVYNDSCQAAQSLADYVPLAGDLNGDCKVDDVDMALLQEDWLKDNSLTEDWFKVE